jgi:hypothetical protein
MSAPEMYRLVDGLGGVREVPVRVEGGLLLVGPGPAPRYYASEEPPRLALMHYALTMRWPVVEILSPGEPSRAELAHRAEQGAVDSARIDRALATIDALTRERDAALADAAGLRAVVAGRETAPTEAEVDAHAAAGGGWLLAWYGAAGVATEVAYDRRTVADALAEAATLDGLCLALPLGPDRRPTAWPAAATRRA